MPDRKAREAGRLIPDVGIFVTCLDPSIGRDDLSVPLPSGRKRPHLGARARDRRGHTERLRHEIRR